MVKVSIIIPCYNSESTIERTIQSCINQNYTDYEIVIIDGDSDDNTISIVEKYKKDLATIICEPDNGVYDAINKGIKQATGDYILILGSDDSLYNNDVLSNVYKNSSIISDLIYGDVMKLPSKTIYDGEFTLKKLFEKNICQQAIFYNRKLFDEIGLFNVKYKSRADYAFNIKVFSMGYKTCYIPLTIANYCEEGLSSHYIDMGFWADYHENIVKPFSLILDNKTIYFKIRTYFFHLVSYKKYKLALKVLTELCIRSRNFYFLFGGFKAILKSFFQTNKQ